jgi:hypothetical protein
MLAALLLAAGCAVTPPAGPSEPPPLLRLPPASLGRSLAQQQLLTVTVNGQSRQLDVMLEAEPGAVRLALLANGQTAARLEWDGVQLKETRAPWLPAVVSSERVLSDLQLVLWPIEAIRGALPAGWSLRSDAQGGRSLLNLGEEVTSVRYPTPSRAELTQRRDGYSLIVESRDLGGGAP